MKFAVVLMIVLIGPWSHTRSTEAQKVTEPAVKGVQPPPSPRFRSGADVVVVDVSVKARDGRFIPGLSAEEFLILDNKVPQNIAFFMTDERVPLAVALLIDRSSSMAGPKLEAAKTAALTFLRTLRPQDLVELVAFNERASRLLPLSTDRAAGEEAIATLSANGGTGLFEAVLVALRDLERAQHARLTDYHNALVILSDGEDTSSLVSFDDVLEDVRRSGMMIHAISLRTDDRQRWLAPPYELARLAYDSGGRAVAVQTVAGLASIYEEIGLELQHLYRLGFVPAPSIHDGQWRSISVRVPGKDVHVRTRSGYYAPRPVPGVTP